MILVAQFGNGDPITGQVSDQGNGTTVGVFKWTPLLSQRGQKIPITLKAIDIEGAITTQMVLVSVTTPPVIPVIWTAAQGVVITGNTITKSTPTFWGNAGATSTLSFAGNGSVEFKVGQVNTSVVCGLSSSNKDANYTTIAYGIYLHNGTIEVLENGVKKGAFGTYQINDRMKVERTKTTVVYKHNDVIFYTSTRTSSGSLLVDSALYDKGASINEAQIAGAL